MKKVSNKPEDNFLTPAQRAFRRVAIKVCAENAKLELSLVLGYLGNKKPKPKNLKPVR